MTAAIPRPLAPWAPLLTPMAADAARALDALAARLALAVGPLPQRTEGREEPDGYDGLTRRGVYERLLATEWLLATEAPDEFDRRAASGEHLFTQLRRRGGASAAKLVVLFDGGPMQLGAPRLVHLALFAVLSARARAAGAAWAFALLGESPQEASTTGGPMESGASALAALGLHVSDAEAGMRLVLEGRSVRASALDDVIVWQRALHARSGRPDARDEVWVIGAPALAAAATARGLASVAVDDGEIPGEHVVTVVVSRPPRAPVALTLPLPASAVCTRVLRDPYGTASAVGPAAFEIGDFADVVLSVDGRKIFWRSRDGQLGHRPVPNSPREPPARARRFPSDWARPEDVFAVGAQGRKVMALAGLGAGLSFITGGRREPVSGPPPLAAVVSNTRLGSVFATGSKLYALLGDGTLLSTNRHGAAAHWTMAVCGLTTSHESLVFIAPGSADTQDTARRDADPTVLYLHRRAHPPRVLVDVIVPLGAIGPTPPRAVALGGHLAWTLDGHVWRVGDESRHTDLVAPNGTEVIAALERGGQPQLLLIESDGRSLVRLGRSDQVSLGRAAGQIQAVRTAPSADVFALLLADGSIEIRGAFDTVPRLVLRSAAAQSAPVSQGVPGVASVPSP